MSRRSQWEIERLREHAEVGCRRAQIEARRQVDQGKQWLRENKDILLKEIGKEAVLVGIKTYVLPQLAPIVYGTEVWNAKQAKFLVSLTRRELGI